MPAILFVFGTRPEAIKLCPVILHMRQNPNFSVRVCVTAQHRGLLDQVLTVFGVEPDHDLDLMLPGQTLFQSTSRILTGMESVLDRERPDMVLVQGDTTTTFAGALASFYKHIPVGHVEAGLRTGDIHQPFPEEANRLLTTRLSSLHFAATRWAADNLIREGISSRDVHVTGNTGIDAVLHVRDRLHSGDLHGGDTSWIDPARKLIVVTAHRRESFGEGFERICRALARLSERQDVQMIYPVHPNPNVQDPVNRILRGRANVQLIEPVSYVPFVDLMRRAYLLITDSGGIQEEGPSLGKPILVLRDKTERPEAVEAGTVQLVGSDENRIVSAANRLLDDPALYGSISRVHNPYGDGLASERISELIHSYLSK